MDINECLVHFTGNLTNDYLEALSGLSDQQLYFLPDESCCHIAFHAWHFARTEDNIVNFVCQDRKQPVWLRQGLPEKWGLPKVDQGTGMTCAEAGDLRLPGLEPLLQYIRDVWTDIEPYLANASKDVLQSLARVVPVGERTKLEHIVQTVIVHGNRHLGQISVLRSVQGLQGESG